MARTYQRGEVHYSDIFFPGHPQAGKDGRLRIPLDTDKVEANMKLKKLIEQRDALKHGRIPKNVSIDDFEVRFKEYSASLSPVTKNHHLRAIRELRKAYPITKLTQVTPDLLQRVVTKWKATNRGLYVRNKDLRSIKMMMRKAEAWGYIEKQDWSSVKQEKEPKGRLRYYTPNELKRLLDACHGVWKTIAILGSRAGLRRAEIYWLRKEDLDFERNRIHIVAKEGWNPKTFERRWVPMSDDLRKHLLGLKIDEWVIEENGNRPTIGSITTYLRRIVKGVKLEGGPHTLRHTFAAHLATAGVPLYHISKLLGHSSSEVTEVYSHLAPHAQDQAILSLPKL